MNYIRVLDYKMELLQHLLIANCKYVYVVCLFDSCFSIIVVFAALDVFVVCLLRAAVLAGIRAAPDDDNSMSGGAIAGAVIGFLVLVALFVGAVVVIVRPPEPLKKYFAPPSADVTRMSDVGGGGASAVKGFDNPLSGADTAASVEAGYNQ